MVTVEVDPQVGKDFIEHFGTRGMKWGVRRSRAERAADSGGSDKIPAKTGPKKVVGKTSTGKPASELSDVRLQKAIARLNMEQNYAKLTAPPPTRTQKLLKATGKFASDVAKQVAAQEIKSVINNPQASKVGKLLDARGKAKIPKAPAVTLLKNAPTGPRFG